MSSHSDRPISLVGEKVVTFENPRAYAGSIRATALVFEDPASQERQQKIEKLALFSAGGPRLFAAVEETVVRPAYAFCRENQVRTARLLGISRNVLRHRLKLYGLI